MKKTIKFTPAKLASLKHPIGKHPDKWYDSGCTGLSVAVFLQSVRVQFQTPISIINKEK